MKAMANAVVRVAILTMVSDGQGIGGMGLFLGFLGQRTGDSLQILRLVEWRMRFIYAWRDGQVLLGTWQEELA